MRPLASLVVPPDEPRVLNAVGRAASESIEDIRNLKQQPGKDMHAVGGATLVSSLMLGEERTPADARVSIHQRNATRPAWGHSIGRSRRAFVGLHPHQSPPFRGDTPDALQLRTTPQA
jgi:hypothetical protein